MMSLKSGYIEVWVEKIDSFIIDSHGFGFLQLQEINEEIQMKETFEDAERNLHVFKPKYNEAERDPRNGRITVPSYWLLEKDEYCKKKTQELRKEMMQMMKEGESSE